MMTSMFYSSEATAVATLNDGPVLSLINKRLRALRKKQNRITQMLESKAQGKPLNKEQEEVLRSQPDVSILIDEYEKLRLPLASAVQEELSLLQKSDKNPSLEQEKPVSLVAEAEETSQVPVSALADDRAMEDLVTLIYFGSLFDVKPQSDFTATMLTRTHERGCCLTYDYVTDDATDLLGERDLDAISALGSLVTSRRICSAASHKNSLLECIRHVKLWLNNVDQPIEQESSVTCM